MSNTIDLTPIINAVIAILAAVITIYVLPWVKSNTTAKQREDMLVWVEIAVSAAQQLYHSADGATRLTYALELLEEKGFDINDVAVKDAVEAAVLKLHQGLVTEND
jgi:hypothetical protein